MEVSPEKKPGTGPSFLSKLLFCWVLPYLKLGKKRKLELKDVDPLPNTDGAESVSKSLIKEWTRVRRDAGENETPSLLKAMTLSFWKSFAYSTFLGVLKDAGFRVAQAPALGMLIAAFSGTVGGEIGVIAGTALIVSLLLYTVLHHYSVYLWYEIGMKIRVALTVLIYEKTLNLSQASLAKSNVGQITNLLTNDANRFDRNLPFIPYLIIGPIQLLTVTIVLWFYLGPSSVALTALLLTLIPLQSWVGKVFGRLRVSAASKTDKRVKLINEVIGMIQLIKMNALENVYYKKVDKSRRSELKVITKKWCFDALNKSVFDVSPKLMIMGSLVAYILWQNETINPTTVFITLTMANYLRNTVTSFMPMAITGLYELRVSIERIQTYLLLEEKSRSAGKKPGSEENTVEAEDLTLNWKDDAAPAVDGATFCLKRGKLTALLGPVGCGKTSLLHGILGELSASKGSLAISGSISYAPQDPWIFSGSIRENILLGLPFNQERYDMVVEACCLSKDFAAFANGDLTSVGDKGMALSGGQKGRVNLARAVYRDVDLYLLDDPLSSIDVRVGKTIFEKCFKTLLKGKTVLLVTHNLNLASQTEETLLMGKAGKMLAYGKTTEVREQQKDLFDVKSSDLDMQEAQEPNTTQCKKTEKDKVQVQVNGQAEKKTAPLKPSSTAAAITPPPTNSVALNHWTYFTSGNGISMLLTFTSFIFLAQAFTSGSDYWLKIWSSSVNGKGNQNNTADFLVSDNGSDKYFYVWVYGAIMGGLFVFSLVRNLVLVWWTMRSSANLHKEMFMKLLRAPLSFYEKNQVGRVLNRIVNDMGNIDDNVPRLYQATVNNISQILGSVVLISCIQPLMIPFALLLIFLFYFVRRFYLETSNDIKRIESVARSPVLSHVATAVNGISVLRALEGSEVEFRNALYQKQDSHSKVFILTFGGNRWFSLATDWIAMLYFVVLLVSFWIISAGDASAIGVTVSTALFLTLIFSFGVSQLTLLDNQLIAVERAQEYISMGTEGDFTVTGNEYSQLGSQGAIKFSNVTVSFNSNPVLQNLSFLIKAGEKIGIVGRTGAGKSTVINSLFRLVPLESGMISLDGVDISKVGLHELRRKLTIIPQVPQLFNSSLRENLDPLGKHEDSKIVRALQDVGTMDKLPQSLDTIVTEGGANFSTGERQLLCLVRALLNKTKVLILDEATASVDPTTETTFQQVVKEQFQDATVITIAHRLDTVMRCEKVMVLGDGELLEFDEPLTLLGKESVFNGMVKLTQEFDRLKVVAEEEHKRRNESAISSEKPQPV